MASRRYCTTRPLDLQVSRALDQLGAATVGSPTTAMPMALSVAGVILLDARLLINNRGDHDVGGDDFVWRDTDRQRQRAAAQFQALGDRVVLG